MADDISFVDAGYWIALLNRSDQHHQRAIQLSKTLTGRFVTTEAVLTEVGDRLPDPRWRNQVATLISDLQVDQNIEIVTVTRELFRRGVQLFKDRSDKSWGLTDCISFVVMQDRGLFNALAFDQHFVQAGFRSLMRESG